MNIKDLTIDVSNESVYADSVCQLTSLHRNEAEPFAIVCEYIDSDNSPVPFSVRLFAAINITRSLQGSKWTGQVVIVGATASSSQLLDLIGRLYRKDWSISYADTISQAYEQLEAINVGLLS